jgi:hypothetical protein
MEHLRRFERNREPKREGILYRRMERQDATGKG